MTNDPVVTFSFDAATCKAAVAEMKIAVELLAETVRKYLPETERRSVFMRLQETTEAFCAALVSVSLKQSAQIPAATWVPDGVPKDW
jgi:hypothetical protein